MVKNNIFLYPFPTSWLLYEPDFDYSSEGQKYLVFFLKYNILIANEWINYLIVPDDDSTFTKEIKQARQKFETKSDWETEEEQKNCFLASYQNLKFIPNFKTEKFWGGSAFLVKNTSQVEKYSGSEPFSEITFRVLSQIKENEVEGCYKHTLEIEPLDLGIEGLPAITRLIFDFIPLGSGQKNLPGQKNLTESELYRTKILSETTGKKFTIGIKSWRFFDNNKSLSFVGNCSYVFNSLKEAAENPPEPNRRNDNNQNDSPNPPQPSKSDDSGEGKGKSNFSPNQADKPNYFLWISLGIGSVLLIGLVIWVFKKKKKKT